MKERENNRERETGFGEREIIGKERLSEREKERDRVWCKREKIIERETGMGKRDCLRERKKETGFGARERK